MKYLSYIYSLLLIAILVSCDDSSENEGDIGLEDGTLSVYLENFAGIDDNGNGVALSLSGVGSTDYHYTSASGERFNVSKLEYFISEIILEGPNGEIHADEMNVSPKAEEVKGYYLVKESSSASQSFQLTDIPAGTYNKMSFLLGVAEEGITEGAAGGVLDVAEGAPFWNWNAGYVSFKLEGTAENSIQQEENQKKEKTYAFHIGGWRDQDENFVNNLKRIEIEFESSLLVGDKYDPSVDMAVDVMNMIDGAEVDFSETFSIHSPKAGVDLADQLSDVFILRHVHQTDSHEVSMEDEHGHGEDGGHQHEEESGDNEHQHGEENKEEEGHSHE